MSTEIYLSPEDIYIYIPFILELKRSHQLVFISSPIGTPLLNLPSLPCPRSSVMWLTITGHLSTEEWPTFQSTIEEQRWVMEEKSTCLGEGPPKESTPGPQNPSSTPFLPKGNFSKMRFRASLVAQWLRVCLLMQGTRVRALVWEDPTCHGATGPVSHNCWACASGACALQQQRPAYRDEEWPPLATTRESPRTETKTQHSHK